MTVSLIGEQSIHGDQHEMSEGFLLDSTRSLGVEVLDIENAFADLEKLLDTPPGVVHVDKVLYWILLMGVDQRGSQTKRAASHFILDQPNLQRDEVNVGNFLANL